MQTVKPCYQIKKIKAQQFARERIAEALYANDAGSAMMKLNAISQSPDKAAFYERPGCI